MIQEKNDVYKEVLTVLAYFNDDFIEKIPDKVLKKLNELAADSKTDFYIDTEKNLYEQNISEESKDLISLIYYNFVADKNEKKELLKIWSENENKYQEKLRKIYNSDNIFQNKRKKFSKDENSSLSSNTAMVEYKKENIFDKIKNFIKKIKLNSL